MGHKNLRRLVESLVISDITVRINNVDVDDYSYFDIGTSVADLALCVRVNSCQFDPKYKYKLILKSFVTSTGVTYLTDPIVAYASSWLVGETQQFFKFEFGDDRILPWNVVYSNAAGDLKYGMAHVWNFLLEIEHKKECVLPGIPLRALYVHDPTAEIKCDDICVTHCQASAPIFLPYTIESCSAGNSCPSGPCALMPAFASFFMPQ